MKKETKTKMGSGLRYNTGKAELHQVPTSLKMAVAKTLMYGAQKYAKGNWRNGMSWTSVSDCLERHMASWLDGEEIDDASGLPHLYHAACNIAFLIEYTNTCPELDDRFTAAPIHKKADSFDSVQYNPYIKPDNKA